MPYAFQDKIQAKQPVSDQPISEPPKIIYNRFHVLLIKARMAINIFRVAYNKYHSVLQSIHVLNEIRSRRKKYMSGTDIQRLIRLDKKFFWIMGGPTWPSTTYDRYVEGEMERISNPQRKNHYLRLVVFGITKKCALSCRHCGEWFNLRQEESLSDHDILRIINKLLKAGVAQIQLSGGEPMSRFHTVLKILEHVKGSPTQIWLLTSGYGLTKERALMLKNYGLTGIAISLDHHDPSEHDSIRGKSGSFDKVVRSCGYATETGLFTCLTLCPSRDFITSAHLLQYLELARALGVAMIQILEPRKAGRWSDQSVEISEDKINILESFFRSVQFGKSYKKHPLVSYHGYNQRRNGCFGSGNRFFYIDPNGDAHRCPFCQGSRGNLISSELTQIRTQLKESGCGYIDKTAVF